MSYPLILGLALGLTLALTVAAFLRWRGTPPAAPERKERLLFLQFAGSMSVSLALSWLHQRFSERSLIASFASLLLILPTGYCLYALGRLWALYRATRRNHDA